jgi:hypothetical protein
MWRDFSMKGCVSHSKGRVLLLMVFPWPDGFRLAAVESAPHKNPEEVFEDHAHLDLGSYPSMDAVTKAARAFVNKWRRKKAQDKCGCGPIDLPATTVEKMKASARQAKQRTKEVARRNSNLGAIRVGTLKFD